MKIINIIQDIKNKKIDLITGDDIISFFNLKKRYFLTLLLIININLVNMYGFIGTLKYVWDFLKRRSDNATKIKLSEQKSDAISRDEIANQYRELLCKFDELEQKFSEQERLIDRALTAFDVLYPIIEELVKEKPEFKGAVNQALKHFNKNPS